MLKETSVYMPATPEQELTYVARTISPPPAGAFLEPASPSVAVQPASGTIEAIGEPNTSLVGEEIVLESLIPSRMLEALPERYLETRPPLMYRLVKESKVTRSYSRIAQSRDYRAKAFSCALFYKPISRCLVEWEE